MTARVRIFVASAFAAVALLGVAAADANALRRCRALDVSAACTRFVRPVFLTAPATCASERVQVVASTRSRLARRLVLRIDGRTVARSRARRLAFVLDCRKLGVGEHSVEAVLLRRDGSQARYEHELVKTGS